MVHHLFNSEDISSDVAQPCLCFPTDSPLFSYLQGKVQGWKHLTTKPLVGIYERITPQHPAYNKRGRVVRLYAADSDGESHWWSYMLKRDFEELLRLSYDELVQMLDTLRADFPLALPQRLGEEGGSFTNTEVDIYGRLISAQIDEDNFDYIAAHLGAQPVAQGQPSSVGVGISAKDQVGWLFNCWKQTMC